MFYYLSKLLPLLVLPLGVTLSLMAAGIIWRKRVCLLLALLVLWVSSLPVVGDTAWRFIEGRQVRTAATSAATADAIVVLSIGRVVAPGPAAVSEWTDADRFFGGVELFKAGKAPRLIFTGGASPSRPDDPSEGEILSRWAVELGVPAGSVATTGRVVNTVEEARAVSLLLHSAPSSRILLVTSAFHMPRAARVFRASGLDVAEFPVDFSGRSTGWNIMDFFPSPGALSTTELALREFYGRAFYALWPL